ncbi:MAG: DNA methylase [Phycisphaerales bacterium]|nr:DNA methylase [Phycisphaerales bacterium]
MQGDKAYVGATPSWVIWQLLMRYTRADDLVVDPMCGSGTTIDVARDLSRRGLGYDLKPARPDIFRADARKLPLEDGKADFVFIDPPYSTHIAYSDDPACIGKLDAAGGDGGRAYYSAMGKVFDEALRVMKARRYMAVYVSDSWRKRREGPEGRRQGGTKGGEGAKGKTGLGGGVFMPIGFELFGMLRERMMPVDMICVVRHNQKLARGNWRKAAEEGNFFLRGFNYLMIFKKQD